MTSPIDPLILESVASPIVVLDDGGRVVYLNRACAPLTALSRNEAAGRPFDEVFRAPAPPPPGAPPPGAGAMANTPTAHEADVVACDGVVRRMRWSLAPLPAGENGSARQTVVTGTDVTDQRATELSLRRSEEFTRRVTEVVPGGLARVSMQGEVLSANAAAQEFLGLVFDETRRVYVADFSGRTVREDGSDFPVAEYPVSRCLRTGALQAPTIVGVIRSDGQTLWGLFSATPLRDAETGGQIGALVTFLDVTESKRAADALRRREEQLRAAFADAPVGMVLGDLSGRIRQVNPAYCRITGHTEADLIGRQFLSITHPDDRARNAELIASVLAEEAPSAVMEKRYVTSDGRIVWGQASAGLARNAQGRPENFVVLVQDVTERKRAEEALRESERRFRQLAEAVDGVFWMIDARTKELLYVSPAYERLWGRSCQSLYDEPSSFHAGIHPDDLASILRIIRPIPRNGFDVQYRVVRPDGSEIWVRDRSFPIRDGRGEVYRLAGIAEDVTERRRNEEAIRAMNEHLEALVAARTAAANEQSRILRSVLQGMGEAVIVADESGRVMLTNPAAERIAGPANPEPHGVESCATPQFLLKADGVTPYPPHELPLARAVRGEAVEQEDMLIARGDRPKVWISATARPLLDEAGNLAGGVLVARDTTDRRKVEQLLRDSERHHRDAAEHNQLLVRELDHRVRNNLAGLLGLVSVMQERVPDVRAFAAAIESRLRAMAHVQQLLATTEWRELDLRVLVDSVVTSMNFMARDVTDVVLTGPAVWISPRRVLPLTLVLAEWLTNSCKYGAHSRGGGKLDVRWEPCRPGDRHRVRLYWEESGGPPPSKTISPSLGTDLVQSFATRELDGACYMGFPETGARHVLEFSSDG